MVTDRDQGYQSSDARYRAIFELAPVALWEEDLTDVSTGISALTGIEDFRSYFLAHPEVVAELAAQIKVVDVNPHTLALFAAPSKDAFLSSLDKVFGDDANLPFIDLLIALAQGAPEYISEFYAYTLSGARIFLQVKCRIFPVEEGRIKALVMLRDDSRRKQAEDELAAQDMVYQTLIESIPHMIWMGDASGLVSDCNRAMAEFLGIASEQALGLDWTDSIHPDERNKVRAIRSAAQAARKSYQGECRMRDADGLYRSIYFVDTPVKDSDDRIIHWVGINTDITHLKETQEVLRTSLERSNRELAQIAHAASHDLQEPLRMITSYAQLLGQRYRGALDDTADKYIGYMVAGAGRIRELIRDILALSNISFEGKPLAPVACARIVGKVVRRMRAEIEAAQAEIVYGDLPTVMADAAQLAQLFEQLFGNSIKFCGEGPPHIEVSARQDNGMWLFTVKDRGIGFDASTYGIRVFQMFQRLNPREQYPGNGIGLALASKIVERHGGRIWVESLPDQGAAFCFTLPGVDMEVV